MPTAGAPRPPAWLTPRAAEVFADLVEILIGMGVSSPDHGAMLALLAARQDDVERLSSVLAVEGETYRTVTQTGETMHRPRPEAAMRDAAARHVQSLLAEFGLSPAAMGKVSARPRRDHNPFAALG